MDLEEVESRVTNAVETVTLRRHIHHLIPNIFLVDNYLMRMIRRSRQSVFNSGKVIQWMRRMLRQDDLKYQAIEHPKLLLVCELRDEPYEHPDFVRERNTY
ncbi:unnamed protein product [Nezara viridula]|uniref:Uncharacterized protein n=1 Tax=Nezara viridula TaxID=85310 RepID=A0A9P0EBW0_NEZVI|nr:unnamed protein product [Nezara viridula]